MRPDPELIEKIRKCLEIPYNQDRNLLTNEQNLMLDELEPLRLGVILFEEIDAIESENSELKSKLAKMGIENGILKEVIAIRPEPNDDNGMTSREYYSGIILQGLLSTTPWSTEVRPSILAENAVLIADALITELSKINL